MEEISSTNGTTQLLYPPLPPKPAPVLSTAVQERLRDLLSKYSQGVWTHALPKIFLDTYKMVFPEEVLAHLPLLQHVCCVEYPAPHDRTKVRPAPSGASITTGKGCAPILMTSQVGESIQLYSWDRSAYQLLQ